ncbi:MAG: histidinol dehydrogenase [Lachnospiraceae bacterium]|nr:histidinol dehydrogenase [Lachnospiraceae bacterium]
MIPIIYLDTPEGKEKVDKILKRSQLEHGNVQQIVDGILADVKANGDKALFGYTEKIDGLKLSEDTLKVTKEEIKEAYADVDEDLLRVIRRSADRIKVFHEKQKRNSWIEPDYNGETLGQLIRPLERVGVYVPGGKAAYPSSVLMNIVPAKVAGVPEIYMVTPAKADGKIPATTIVAAVEAGADVIYKVGGAQAIAALAFGTESVKKVDKIVGPGNIFVALAKKSVYGHVNIDSVAGPSEILVIADESADPVFVAADLLSQAEHDELASAVLITTSDKLAKEVQKEVEAQTAVLERKDIINRSIENYGAVIVTKTIEEACELSNHIAPEHLEISTSSPFELLNLIKNAGAVFLGHYSPEPLGDYMAGPNHVLPTGQTAKFFSPLNVDDFIKKSSIIHFTKDALMSLSDDIIKFAQAEGLTAHANSVRVRKN